MYDTEQESSLTSPGLSFLIYETGPALCWLTVSTIEMLASITFTERENCAPLELSSPWVLFKTQKEQKWHRGKNLGHIRPTALLIGKEHESRLGHGEGESESHTTFK